MYNFLRCRQPAALLAAAWLSLGIAPLLSAGTYTTPRGNRTDTLLNEGWRFAREEKTNGQEIAADDSAWTAVTLPHTWNALDGQDGGNDYHRGPGWYRRHFAVNAADAGRRVFLKFDGAFVVTDVWVNGRHAGRHEGGFAAFVFDVTDSVRPGPDNLLAVRVSNAPATNVPPLSADFTFFGGLYRDVHLLATDPVHISPLDYGSPGVYLQTLNVTSNSATLRITTVVSNATAEPRPVRLRAVVVDAASRVVATLTNLATLPAAASSNLVASTLVSRPHLWDGLRDPYLYRVSVELLDGGRVSDCVSQPLGFRSFHVDPQKGAFLNGRYVDLYGVSLHQDWPDKGWAIGHAERETNFALLKEIGATALRLSHYEHSEETYALADRAGLVVWSEVPVINRITESPAFYTNAAQQLRELIRQRYNHPAVVCWGIYNEITLKPGPNTAKLVAHLAKVAAAEDPTRPSTAAANAGDDEPSNWFSDIVAFNKYFGWYDRGMEDFGPWADKIHAARPARCIGIGEYGAGASAWQHSENPKKPNPDGHFHPEEYQNLLHESHWQQMKARPYLWCKFVWNLCEFASDGRNEGDTPGRNDKGIVTYDRALRKDTFYWYQANWTTNPMVYITGHTFTNRLTNAVTAKVYANCDEVELRVNGKPLGAVHSTNRIFTWPVKLRPGSNLVEALGTKGSARVGDFLVWNAPASAAPSQPANAAAGGPSAPPAPAAPDPGGN
jgi:beta-galactosidase